jgi:hypothetical protein
MVQDKVPKVLILNLALHFTNIDIAAGTVSKSEVKSEAAAAFANPDRGTAEVLVWGTLVSRP